MPASDAEMLRVVDGLVTDLVAPDQLDDLRWEDGSSPTEDERRTMLLMYGFVMRDRRKPPGQRKAMRLLRSLLTGEQRRMFRNSRYFHVTSKSGATFRFHPRMGTSSRVERHGKRWYAVSSFCLHDEDGTNQLPPADIVIAHLLLIVADEGRFLRLANEHKNQRQLWNRDYLRGLRERRATG